MFTGIVEAKGRVRSLAGGAISVEGPLSMEVGWSVSVNGVCLTVTGVAEGIFEAHMSEETLARTNLGGLMAGDEVNLERPVPAGGRLGGHIVQGHVDGRGKVSRIESLEGSEVMWIEVPPELSRYLVPKGSVAVDGVSLTIAGFEDRTFSVSLVPHTTLATNLGTRRTGDLVNIEVDILAKYTERLLHPQGSKDQDWEVSND